MTEAEWLTCADSTPMLEFLRAKVSDRKLRLFAVNCCRSIWHLLKDEQARNAVEVAERYADGLTGRDSLIRAVKEVPMPEWPSGGPEIFNWRLVTKGIAADMTDPRTYVWLTGELGIPELTPERVATKWVEDGASIVSASIQADFLRELFGNPFRPVVVEPSWLTSTAIALAEGSYEERAFDRMPILADALQDAGCDNDDILNHCRQPGEHVRGCWVVDLVLGKS